MEEAAVTPEGALGAAHLLAAASVGFALALVLSAWAPSLALFLFSPKPQRSSSSTTSVSSLGPKRFIATDSKALGLPAEAEDDEEDLDASKGQGKAKECQDGHQAQPKAKETVASVDQGQPHEEERDHNDEGDDAQDPGGHATDSSSTLSSSPSFPRLVQASSPTSSSSSSSPVPSSLLRRAVIPEPSSPAPPSPLPAMVASPSLGSSASYPPHSGAPSESAPATATSSSLTAPPARLMKRQTTFADSATLGQARDMEATSCLPNPAVQQWWEMERLLEKEYATIEEKAFGVMMKLMPFRSGEGLKDPPKIVPNPYHGNRVVLESLEGALPEHDTTFYNASYIKKGKFIAASMPHNDLTRQDFWRMIYEQDCRLIVMLNLEDESHGDPYWPNELNNTTHYGPMAITKTEQMRMRFYESTVRKFTISRTDRPDAPPKQVLHVHNTVWPDKGIPENVEAFTDMVEYVKQEYEQLCENKTGPMTVHCFGGIGRTGSFLTCMICLLSIREIQEASVFTTVLNLRTDRAMMVQTTEQYKFCYRVVMELSSRSKRKVLHRGLSGVLRRSAKPKPGAAIATPSATLLSVPAVIDSV